MRRATRWTLRMFAGLVVLIVVAIMGGAIFIHTDTGRAVVREKVVETLSETFAGEVSIGALEGSPFGTLVARDITIRDAHGHPAVAIDRVALDLQLRTLVRKRATITKLTVDGARIDVLREADGTWSLAHLLRPTPPSTWTVVIDELVINGGIAVDTNAEPIHLDNLSIAGALRTSPDALAASIAIHGTWRERAAPIQILASAKRDGDRIEVPALAIHAGAASVHVANASFDGATFGGTGFVRAPREDVVRLARIDSLADLGLAFRAKPAVTQRMEQFVAQDREALAGIVATKPVEGEPPPAAPAQPVTGATHVELVGGFGESGMRGELDVWLAARRIAGAITGSNIDLAKFSRDRGPVTADGTVMLDVTLGPAQLPTGHAAITALARATGRYAAAPPTHLSTSVKSDGKRVTAKVDVRNAGLVANASADVLVDGERVALEAMKLAATASDLFVATGGIAPARGRVELVANAHGPVLPSPALAVTGKLDGKQLRVADFSVGSIVAAIDARSLPARPIGRAEVVARNIDKRGESSFALRELELTAADRPDGAIAASLRTRPKQDPWLVEAEALIRLGETVIVDLQRHRLRARTGGEWTGTTGRVAIGRERITLRDFTSVNRGSSVALAGSFERAGRRAGDLEAHATVKQIALGMFEPTATGKVDARVDVKRTRGQLTADASFDAKGITLAGFGDSQNPTHFWAQERRAHGPKVQPSPEAKPSRVVAGVERDPVRGTVEKSPPFDATTETSKGVAPTFAPKGPNGSDQPANSAKGEPPPKGQVTASKGDPPPKGQTNSGEKAAPLAAKEKAAQNVEKVPVVTQSVPVKPPVPLPFDAKGTIKLDARGLAVAAEVDAKTVGAVRVQVDVATPTRPEDVRAWKRLERTAIRVAQLDLAKIDLGKLLGATDPVAAGLYGGRLDGQIRIDAGVPSGRIAVTKVTAPQLRGLGDVNAEVTIAKAPGERSGDIDLAFGANLDVIGRIDGKAELRVPERVFDLAEWKKLDRKVLRRATVAARELAIDPGRLQQLGIVSSARGRVSFDAEVLADRASANLSVVQLRGSPLAQPVDATVRATIDDKQTAADVSITSTNVKLLEAHAEVPLTFAQLFAAPNLATTPITATAKVPQANARALLGVFGRTEVIGGTLDGEVQVRGTIGAPTATLKLVGTNLQVPPGAGGKPIKVLQRMVVAGEWRDGGGTLSIDAEQPGGKLAVRAAARPDRLADATFSVVANSFDLVPLLAFAPGPAGGAAGRLDANLTVKGADPATAKIAGEAHLEDARIPIAPAIGTLRRAKIDLVVKGSDLHITVDGRLGGGTVKADGAVSLIGANPSGGKLEMRLREVRPIGVVEPQVDADVTVAMRRDRLRWIADVDVRNARVKIPSSRGQPLAPPGAPADMVFVTGERITRRPMDKQPPEEPIFVANIAIAPTRVESEEIRGTVKGKLTLTADGEALGMVGVIEADRGEIDLFGRRYKTERAVVRFDGTTDPLLDIAIVHEFPEVAMTAQVRGRVSQPRVILRSNPATYSEAQLLGFLLGGEPNGDPAGAGDRATGAGASYVANRLGGYVKKTLPIDIDVLRYEAATATSSAAITVGTWLNYDLFLAYRRRLEARPDENAGEGEVEYWLVRRVVVEGVVGDRGRNTVDLLWRKRY